MRGDVGIGMCATMRLDMCVGMQVDICVGMCVDVYVDMRCVDLCVWTHVCRHVGRHLCLPDDVHIGMNKDMCQVLWVYVCEHWVWCEVPWGPSHRAA